MALLKLRRGTSLTSTAASAGSEIYFNTTLGTLQVGDNSSTVNIVKIGSNTGNVSFSGTLGVTGISTLGVISGSNLHITDNATIKGNLTLGGSIYLGDGTVTDEIIVNASLSGSLVPDTNEAYDLGSNSFKYKNLYVATASIDNITLGGSDILSSSLGDYLNFDDYTSSLDSHFSNLDLFTSSQQTINGFYNTFTGSIGGRLTNLELDSSSQDSRLDNLELTTSSFEDRISQLETDSGSQDSRLDNLESTTQSLDGRLDNVELFTSSYFTDSASIDSRLDTLEGSFSTSVDSRIDLLESFSSSLDNTFVTTTELHTATSSLSASLTITDVDFENRINTLETTFSSSVDNRLDNLESTGSNHESRIDGLETYTGSNDTLNTTQNNRLSSLQTYTGSNDLNITKLFSSASQYQSFSSSIDTTIKTKINIEGVFSSSIQVNANDITNFDVNVKDKLNVDGVISGSSQVQINSVTGFTSYSSSVDGRLDTIEGSFSTSVDSRLDNIETYTSSLKDAINVSGQDLTIYGNLVVQGETTTLNTTELLIEDKVLAIASGSTTSAAADGAGLYISGADASILWNDGETLLEINQKVSSSIGFKGDGSELTGVTAAGIDFDDITNKPSLVSGSSQVTSSLDLRYLLIDGDNVFTGSSQVDLTQTTNYISGIKTRLNTEGVFSSSIQVNANDITNFDTNVKDKLNVDGVISGSSQVQINSVTGFTSYSSSVDSRLDTLEGSFSTSVDSRLDNLELDSASQDLRLDNIELTTQSLDGRLDNVELFTSSYFTDSASVDSRLDNLEGSFSTSVDSRLDYIEGQFSTSLDSRLDLLENFSSSQYINDSQSFDTRLDYLEGDFSTSLDSRLDSVEGDQHTHSNKANLDEINQDLATTDAPSFIGLSLTSLLPQPTSSIEFDAVFLSSSNELTYRTLGNAILYNVTSSQDVVLESGSIAYESDNLLTAGAVKKYVDWRTEELVTAIGAADITSVTANAGLTGGGLTGAVTLSLDTGSVHFNNGVVSNLVSLNSFTQSYFTDSASIDTRLDGLESFSSSLNSGFVTEAELASATGSLINSIATKLNTGSYNTDSASFDSRIDVLESDSISQDGRLDNLELTTASFDGRLDNLELDSASQDSRLDNIEGFTSSIDTTIKTKLNIEGVISGSDQLTSSYDSRYVNETDFTSFSSSVDGRLDLLETNSSSLENIFEEKASGTHTLVSGSSQVLDILSSLNTYTGSNDTTNTTQNSRLDQLSTYTGSNETAQSAQNSRLSSLETKTGSLDTEQSAQNSRLNQLSTYTGSNDTTNTTQNSRLDQLSTYTGSNDTTNTTQNSRLSQIESVTSSLDSTYEEKASGTHTLVSGSSQIQLIKTDSGSFSTNMVVEGSNLYYTDTRVKTKLNTEGVISGSDQLTGSLVDLTSDQTVSGTKTFNDIVVNGTGSFAYITSVSGNAKIIGDNYIVLNNDTPTQRYAGIAVYDSGSATPTTASFNFDGQTNDWFYEYSASTVDYGVVLFGPEYNTKGNPTYLTANRIPKAEGTHHLNDSNITDSGTLITLGSNTIVNGTLLSTGTSLVSGSSQINFTQLSGISSNIISASSDTAQVDMIITGGSISANLKGGVVSGSSQITYSGISSIPSGIVSGSTQITPLLPSGTVSGSAQIDITLTTGTLDISSRTNLAVSDTAQVDMILTGDTLSANLKGGVVSGSSQIDITTTTGTLDISSRTNLAVSDTTNIDMILTGDTLSANLKGGVVSGSGQLTDMTGDITVNSSGVSAIGSGVIVNADVNVSAAIAYTKLNLGGSGIVSGSTQITKTLQDVTTAGNTTTTTISITNTTASTSKTTGALIVSGGIGTSGGVFAGGDVVAYASSDRRLKDNITPITNPLQKINQIGGYSFVWNENQNTYKGKDYGVIAQEIEEILPELVDTRENGYKAVKYDKLVSLLIEGIKELSSEVEELKRKLNT
jgi:hypothetical protein